jgi:ribosomal protein L11
MERGLNERDFVSVEIAFLAVQAADGPPLGEALGKLGWGLHSCMGCNARMDHCAECGEMLATTTT